MAEYLNTAMSLNGSTANGALLLMELFSRMQAGIFGPNKLPRCLTDWAWAEAGYNIYAPELLPAGGCRGFTFQDAADLGPGVEQIYAYREGDTNG